MNLRIAAILAVLGSAGCNSENVETFSVSGERYAVPAAHIRSIERESPAFIRIAHPDVPFELIYDGRTAGARDERGIPQVFSINDSPAPNIEYHRVGRRVVVCRRAVAPRNGCGIKVRHGRAEWSVRFPFGHVEEADRIADRAISLLNHYER